VWGFVFGLVVSSGAQRLVNNWRHVAEATASAGEIKLHDSTAHFLNYIQDLRKNSKGCMLVAQLHRSWKSREGSTQLGNLLELKKLS
jgi:hypothetical protein